MFWCLDLIFVIFISLLQTTLYLAKVKQAWSLCIDIKYKQMVKRDGGLII